MNHAVRIAAVTCLLFSGGLSCLQAQEETGTVEAKQGFFQVVENVTATVESQGMTELTPDTRNWTSLKISEVLPEGTVVRQGDVIVRFDTEDIERQLSESRQAVELAAMNLRESQLENRQLNQTLPLDQTLAARVMRNAEQDYQYFTEVEKANRQKTVRRNVENSQHALEYATEEYNQLKRMYEEDELTEESEEIVLKRTQRDVESRQFFLEQAQMRAARTLDYEIPREMEEKTDALERARLANEKAEVMLPLEREKSEVAIAKAKFAYDKDRGDLDKLESDLERMIIRAPTDGLVYYGHCQRGKWLGQTGPQRNLEAGSSVVHNKPLITLVDPARLMLRADLTESQLAGIRVDSQGIATPVARPDSHLPVVVSSVSLIPISDDKFDCTMGFRNAPADLMPGMKCQVRFQVYANDTAITVPDSCVFTDDGVKHYVFVPGTGEDARPVRRDVQTGHTANNMTEITRGLAAGDKVLQKRP